jgi:hypothetical protein
MDLVPKLQSVKDTKILGNVLGLSNNPQYYLGEANFMTWVEFKLIINALG